MAISIKWLPTQPSRFFRNPSNVAILILLVIIIVSGLFWLNGRTGGSSSTQLSSPSFGDGDKIPKKFTCDGENVSPELRVKKAPEGAKTFAIILEDLDINKEQYSDPRYLAQQMVWNIPATTTTFTQGVRPPGTMGRTLEGNYIYNGPCPPKGETHRYRFTIYSLSSDSLAVGADAGVEELRSAISKVEISKDELNFRYTGSGSRK